MVLTANMVLTCSVTSLICAHFLPWIIQNQCFMMGLCLRLKNYEKGRTYNKRRIITHISVSSKPWISSCEPSSCNFIPSAALFLCGGLKTSCCVFNELLVGVGGAAKVLHVSHRIPADAVLLFPSALFFCCQSHWTLHLCHLETNSAGR